MAKAFLISSLKINQKNLNALVFIVGHPHRMGLPQVPGLQGIFEINRTLTQIALQTQPAFGFQLGKYAVDVWLRVRRGQSQKSPRQVHPCARNQHAQGGKVAWMGWHNHMAYAQRPGQHRTKQGATATKHKQFEVPGINASFDGDVLDRSRHGHRGNVQNTLSSFFSRQIAEISQGLGNQFGDHCFGRLDVQAQLALHEVARANAAQHHIGVGHGGLSPATAKGHRAGLRSRAFGAHTDAAKPIDCSYRAAAGAHFHNVQDRCFQREPALIPAHIVNRVDIKLTVLYQRAFGGGPAHVKRDEAINAQ